MKGQPTHNEGSDEQWKAKVATMDRDQLLVELIETDARGWLGDRYYSDLVDAIINRAIQLTGHEP